MIAITTRNSMSVKPRRICDVRDGFKLYDNMTNTAQSKGPKTVFSSQKTGSHAGIPRLDFSRMDLHLRRKGRSPKRLGTHLSNTEARRGSNAPGFTFSPADGSFGSRREEACRDSTRQVVNKLGAHLPYRHLGELFEILGVDHRCCQEAMLASLKRKFRIKLSLSRIL